MGKKEKKKNKNEKTTGEIMHSKKTMECSNCHKTKKIKCFIFNKIKKEKICRQCNRIIGNNVFYTPLKHQNVSKFGRYSLSEQERELKYQQLISAGFSPEYASHRLNFLQHTLRMNYFRRRGLLRIRKNKEILEKQESKKQKEEFIKGLR